MFDVNVEEWLLFAADGLIVGEADKSDVVYVISDGPAHEVIAEAIRICIWVFSFFFGFGLEYILFKEIERCWAIGGKLHDVFSQKISHKR